MNTFVAMYDNKNRLTGAVHNILNHNHNNNHWILLDQNNDSMKGVTMIVEESSGNIITVSTRTCPDKDRWKSVCMPLLRQDTNDDTYHTTSSYDFTTTQILDLHNSRYICELHPTMHLQMPNLRQLILTRCDRLQGLPDSIGSLHYLQEVRFDCDRIFFRSTTNPFYYFSSLRIVGFYRFSDDSGASG
jgi:hypothetical protein